VKITKGGKKSPTPSKGGSKAFPDFATFLAGLGTWKKPLSTFTSSKTFGDTYGFVKSKYEEGPCYPQPDMIFNCFATTPIEDVKVVIVGQDPYHQPGQAMGLCFSVFKGVKVPPSLVNIYKCIENDKSVEFKKPTHGDLSNWASQGVFLLNTVLTVSDSKPNSHKASGWLKFSDEVIKTISKECKDVIFLLWGTPAQQKKKLIDLKKHHILESVHPSPLSAHRGFLDCEHFSKVNKKLEELGKPTIDWNKINED